MKTRVIHTKIWQDGWFKKQDLRTRYYYLYLLLNEYMDISYFQEISLSVQMMETGLSEKEIKVIHTKLKKDGKILTSGDYLYLCNGYKYATYSGIKNSHKKLRILYEMSDKVLKDLKKAVLFVITDVDLDLEETKTKGSDIYEKVMNLRKRLLYRLNLIGLKYPHMDTPIYKEGKNQKSKLEIKNQKTENKRDIDKIKKETREKLKNL